MSDFAQEIYQHIVAVIISAIIMILLTMAACEWSEPAPKVAPQVPIRKQVLSYPYRDGSKELRAAERKVKRKIDKIEEDFCTRHMNTSPRCGAWQKKGGKWEKVK